MPYKTVSPPSRLAVVVATVVGNLFLIVGSLVCGTLAIFVGWIPPRTRWAYAVSRFWARGVLATSGVKVEAVIDPALDPAGRYVFLANHQSLFDIPVLLASAPGSVRLVAKKTLFQIPVFGWAMHAAGYIPVDREDRSKALGTFRAAAEKLRAGTSILLFPEGTRSRTGELAPFQRGGFLLAMKSGLAIVPVGIRGTFAVQPRHRFSIHPGKVIVSYGAPIDIREFGLKRKRDLMGGVREKVAELAGLDPQALSSEALDAQDPLQVASGDEAS